MLLKRRFGADTGANWCTSCFICRDRNGNSTDDKGSEIKLIDELKETDDKLGYITNRRSDQMEARIEVPAKENCRIMLAKWALFGFSDPYCFFFLFFLLILVLCLVRILSMFSK